MTKGLIEYLEWCEDMGLAPILGVWAGFALESGGNTPFTGDALTPYLDEVLNELEVIIPHFWMLCLILLQIMLTKFVSKSSFWVMPPLLMAPNALLWDIPVRSTSPTSKSEMKTTSVCFHVLDFQD